MLIFISSSKKTSILNKKINMHAYLIKYAQNGAFTNGTP